jgi:hypothetical protein
LTRATITASETQSAARDPTGVVTEKPDAPLVRAIALAMGCLLLGIACWVVWLFATLARPPLLRGQLATLQASEITILSVLAGLSVIVGFGAWRALRLGAPNGIGPLPTGTGVVVALVATVVLGLVWR